MIVQVHLLSICGVDVLPSLWTDAQSAVLSISSQLERKFVEQGCSSVSRRQMHLAQDQ